MIPSDNFKPAPMTSNEERRLEALKRLGVIGTDQGDIFDIYSEIALEVSGFFAATCSLIDVDTQHGISLCSLNGELEKMTEGKPVKVERAQSPCAYTILTPEPLLVPDCREHKIFKDAGFEWRQPGCSMCLGMNPDQLKPKERCASTSNRNFEGRQGRGGRTHLVSPGMAIAAAIKGRLTDVREI